LQASNQGLWEKLLSLCDKHEVEFKWVRAHNGNIENERCDQLSYAAANEDNLLDDFGYYQILKPQNT
jgi:ribonuclease HI